MYTFMKCLSWIICHIPEGCRRALGTFLGAFFWTFVPKKRKVLAQQQILDCGLTEDARALANYLADREKNAWPLPGPVRSALVR